MYLIAITNLLFSGIRFNKISNEHDANWLKISIRGTEVDWDSGTLKQHSIEYRKSVNDDFGSINFHTRLHPLSTNKKTRRESKDNYDFIRFMHSDLNTDSGQTAVPFWDSQTVAPLPATPLLGAGFIWRSIDNSGGFVAPIVVSLNYDELLDELNKSDFDSMINNLSDEIRTTTLL